MDPRTCVTRPTNISGLWMGQLLLPPTWDRPRRFLARIEDHDGKLSGTSWSRTRSALVRAAAIYSLWHAGGIVRDFVKAYDGASDAAHAVDYVGRCPATG
jgi:hypothetical protein